MLLSQFLVVVLSVVRRFDAVALHARDSVREALGAALRMRTDSEANLV